jgi:ferredoxin
MDCVEVCPVNCFREGGNMLVIHPGECIDCGVCEAECPEEAILSQTDPRAAAWMALNARYAMSWPVILERGSAPQDADNFHGMPGKCAKFFDPEPGPR